MVTSLASFKFYESDGGVTQHIFMFREFEKEVKKKTPKVSFRKYSLESKKVENNIQENLLAMCD